MAFIRDSRLWIADINNNGEIGETIELATVDPSADDLEFSPDGQTIVFADPGGIWTMGAADATPTLLLESSSGPESGNHFYAPHYAPNINAFLVVSDPGETSHYYIFDPASGGLVDIGAYHSAQWMVDGRLLSHGDGMWMADWPATAELSIIDLATSPPQTLPILQADGMRIHDVRVTAPAQLGIVMSDNSSMGPLAMSLYSLPIMGGEPQYLADLGFIDQPKLSPDGAFVAGTAYPDGKLIIYSVADDLQTIIDMPSGVSDFTWQREW
jgi:hypothetical protein